MTPDCIICGSEMMLEKRFKNQKSKRGNRVYRIRRFKCPHCDYKTTIFADGIRDLKSGPDDAIEAVKKHFENEEEARE